MKARRLGGAVAVFAVLALMLAAGSVAGCASGYQSFSTYLSTLTVGGATTLNGETTINNDATISGTLTVGDLDASGAITGTRLYLSSASNPMTISNNVSLTGTLDIATGGLAWGDVSKSGSTLNDLATLSASKAMTISNNVSLTGTLDIATGGLAWGDVSKSGSSLNDLATISTSKPVTVTNLTVNGTCTGCGSIDSLDDIPDLTASEPMTITNLTVNGTCTGCGSSSASFGWPVPVSANWITATNVYSDIHAATGIVAGSSNRDLFISVWEGPSDPDDYGSFQITGTGELVWSDFSLEQAPMASFPITGTVYIIGIAVKGIN